MSITTIAAEKDLISGVLNCLFVVMTRDTPAMNIRYRNIDSLSTPQTVTIEFVREQTADEHPDLSFLRQDYSDLTNTAAREKCEAQDAARLKAYNNGEWHVRSLWVTARISVPIGQGLFALYELRSPGLGGIESDCDAERENEAWEEEEDQLREHMKAMGATFAALGA